MYQREVRCTFIDTSVLVYELVKKHISQKRGCYARSTAACKGKITAF